MTIDSTHDFAARGLPGEVSGALLLGLVGAFYNLQVLPQGGLTMSSEKIEPQEWYPYSMFIDIIHDIERVFPAKTSRSLLFRAGIHFQRTWYEQGPGRELMHSSLDWLRLHRGGAVYNSVVRGGSPAEIGWCHLTSFNEETGTAVFENVMPTPPDFVRGLFYGGCMIFDDMDFVAVAATDEPYSPNANFRRVVITVRFHAKPDRDTDDLDALIDQPDDSGLTPVLTPAEVGRLVWRHRALRFKAGIDSAYFNEINPILSDAITAGERQAAELARAREAAESANRAKSAFLANMSHELRTPLNAILGYSQMMMRDRAPDAPDADTLRIINRSGEHLLGLINSVLDLAKIESHKYTLEPEDFDLGQFLLELTDILRRRAEDKGVTLAVDQSSSFPRHVRADRNKLRQVLINIVGNAIKFTSAGGVTLKLTTNGQLRTDGVGELVFTVTDTGPGIHPEDIERIFKPFEQAAHRPKAEGTGLGLALAREFVRLMGGDVRVTSEYGHGSVFTFTIAFSPVDETSLEKLRAPPLGDIIAIEGAAGLRVLIVEDHPENRVLLRKILTPFGFDLAEAENGEIGVRLAAEWKPHLVLMDRRMPVMDGVTATRRIRELPEGAKIRISAVTAEAFKEDCASMMEAGCDAFVRKPYRIDEILTVVADLLPVKLVRAEAVPGKAPAPVGDEAEADATRAAFAKLPPDVAAAVRAACDAADTERVAELLAPHAEAAAAAAPFLGSFRTDRLAALLPA